MQTRNFVWVGHALFALLAGCSNAHEGRVEPPSGYDAGPAVTPDTDGGAPPVVDGSTPIGSDAAAPPDGGTAVASALEDCLDEGGHLVTVDTVNNNDVEDHGAISAFAVSPDRTIAAAGTDGTIKFWTLDALVGTVRSAELLYGAEIDAAEASDMQFIGDHVAAGDLQGLVAEWGADGFMRVLGGTDPDTPIVAVAIDAARRFLAHADNRAGGHVMVRAMDGTSVTGPLDTSFALVTDLAFLPSGALLVAGRSAAGAPLVELRAASDFARVETHFERTGAVGTFSEIAASADGSRIAAASGDEIALLDGALGSPVVADVAGHGALSVSIGATGRYVLSAGTDGTLRALAAGDGHEAARADVIDPISVRIDPRGELVFVATRGALIHAFACER